MHLRRVKVKSGGTYRCYSQIVQSQRRKDGVTVKRVLANLGTLSDEAYENFKMALEASRDGRKVVTLPAFPDPQTVKPDACLQYLDLAVLVELWRDSIAGIVADALPPRTLEGSEDIVAALALQRCVAPGSKLQSVRWVPRTALPELLGLNLNQYNNTRVHRVLNALDEATPGIQSRIAPSFQQTEGFASVFVDMTDTWFEGKGPTIAQKGKTKEGMTKRKIGIVMMCSDQGYPLRWEVCEGNSADCTEMTALLRKVSGVGWLSGKPAVCDRAMGSPSTLMTMSEAGIYYVTALREPDFDGFGCSLPANAFADIVVSNSVEVQQKDLATATAAAATCDELHKMDDELFIKGLGKLTWETNDIEGRNEPATVRAMRLCQEIEQAIADGNSRPAAARRVGISTSLANRYSRLSKLSKDIQLAVRSGKGMEYGIAPLLRIAEHTSIEKQEDEFDKLLASPLKRDIPQKVRPLKVCDKPVTVTVNAVAYFSPRYFVESRARAQRKRLEVETFVDELNGRARSGGKTNTPAKLLAAVENELRKHSFLTMFDYDITQKTEAGREFSQVELNLNEEQWRCKRAVDGFMVVVAHPDLKRGDEELVRLYRAKDRIESDFRTIKKLLHLRPIHHREVTKVTAHVSVCMLSLLLERLLGTRLKTLSGVSAQRALELLEPCRLAMVPLKKRRAYASTTLDKDQDRILRHLGMLYLGDDRVIADRITPRI